MMRGLILLLLVSCSTGIRNVDGPSKAMKPSELTDLIVSKIKSTGIKIYFHDEAYTSFGGRLYFEEILKNYRKLCFDLDVNYSKKYDCDDYARGMQHFFQVHYSKSSYDEQSFALGVVFYRKDEQYNHAVCVAVINGEVLFIEPQNGLYIELSEQEKKKLFRITF